MGKLALGLCLVLISVSSAFVGCAPVKKDDSSSTDTGGTPFTAADIAKAWTSNCITRANATLGTSYYKMSLTLDSGGTFTFSEYEYVASGSPCSNADYISVHDVRGTYTVGSAITGGQQLNFVTDANPSLMVLGTGYTATQDIFNNDCGGTSPYCTLSGGTCTNNGTGSGVSKNSRNMLCQNFAFPPTGTTIYNVASWDGTNFYIGAGVLGNPGVYTTGALATSATVYLH